MRKLVGVLGLLLLTLPAVCQSTSKYQVATILEIKSHQQSEAATSDLASYDVSVKVGETIYVVLYTPHLGESGAKYAAGQDLLVKIGTTTITYNDIMGRSYEVPIETQRPVPAAKEHSR